MFTTTRNSPSRYRQQMPTLAFSLFSRGSHEFGRVRQALHMLHSALDFGEGSWVCLETVTFQRESPMKIAERAKLASFGSLKSNKKWQKDLKASLVAQLAECSSSAENFASTSQS